MSLNHTNIKILGIDASRCKSGGAINHVVNLLKNIDPVKFKINEIHIWAYDDLLDKLPKKKWLFKHTHKFINSNLLSQLFWQAFIFHKSAQNFKCDLVLNLDAGTVSRFEPSITMSRDMLSYEPQVKQLFKFSFARLRIETLYFVQNYSLRKAKKSIFLTNYARRIIINSTGALKSTKIIPHGVGENFRKNPKKNKLNRKKIKIIYVSNTDPYKHHEEVLQAVSILKKKYKFELILLGGRGFCENKIANLIKKFDKKNEYITRIYDLKHSKLSSYTKSCDIFLFASSCENMPNTLIEGMASGTAIASSSRGPMPEILGKAGVYFDPKDSASIYNSLSRLLNNKKLREKLAYKAYKSSLKYSWKRCADETLKYITLSKI